jgi:hypothetical protein
VHIRESLEINQMERAHFAGRLSLPAAAPPPGWGQRDRGEIQRREEGFLLEDLRLDDFFDEEEVLRRFDDRAALGWEEGLRPPSRLRLSFARAASIMVFTSCFSSGGGMTARRPSDFIHSSRDQPMVW